MDSDIFRYNPNTDRFELFQSLPTSAATRLRPFVIATAGGDITALVALNYRIFSVDFESTETQSQIYTWSSVTGNFQLLQEIDTIGAVDAEAFTVGGTTRLVVINNAFEVKENGIPTVGFRYNIDSTIYRYDANFDPRVDSGPFVFDATLDTLGASDAEIFTPDGGVTYLMVVLNRKTGVRSDVGSQANVYLWRPTVGVFALRSSFDGVSFTSASSFRLEGATYLAVASNQSDATTASSHAFVYRYFSVDNSFFLRVNESITAAQDLEPLTVGNSVFLAAASSQPAGALQDIDSAATTDSPIFRLFLAGAETDFASTAGTLYFGAGETSKSVTVPIANNAEAEADEIFIVVLPDTEKEVTIAGSTPVEVVVTPRRISVPGEPSPAVEIAQVTLPGVTGASAADLAIVAGNEDSVFTFDGFAVVTQAVLDRESVEGGRYTLLIRYEETGNAANFGLAWLIVDVEDVNDNPPFFEGNIDNSDNFQQGVFENEPVGTLLMTLVAMDADTSVNVIYSIDSITNAGGYSGPSPAFEIDATTGDITTLAVFDREELRNDFIINVRATDRDRPGDVATAFIVVPILDANDFTPAFLGNFLINSTVPEFPSTGINEVVIGDIRIRDLDDDDNGVVDLDIVAGDDTNVFQVSRDGTSGGVTTFSISAQTVLDFEDPSDRFFNLTLRACDRGTAEAGGGRCSFTRAEITTTDINDNSPIFGPVVRSVNTDFSLDRFLILETLPAGSDVLTISATDADSGANGRVSYSLTSTSTKFQVDNTTGLLTVLQAGLANTYTVGVAASDAGSPSNEDNDALLFAVLDIPVFTMPGGYSTSVAENTVGSLGFGVLARVQVLPALASLRYSIIAGNSLGKFSISATGGQLSVASGQSLDFEGADPLTYTLTVSVRDIGTTLDRSTTVQVTITVTDSNDVAPVFSPDTVALAAVPEDNGQDAFVARALANLTVVDPDTVGTLSFTITSTFGVPVTGGGMATLSSSLFAVSSTGLLSTNGRLDRETYQSYQIGLRVSDGQASDFATVTLPVTNVNDVDPFFLEGSMYTASINESASIGDEVLRTVAADGDVVEETLSYSLGPSAARQSGDGDETAFAIDSAGTITVAQMLDFETATRHVFEVTAEDSLYSVTTTVVVSLDNANEFSPAFTLDFPSTVSVGEDAAVGTLVATVEALDEDAGDTVTYALGGSAATLSTFAINATSGQVTTRAGFDRESTASYSLFVTARDSGGRATTMTLTVIITDVNDNTPVFAQASYAPTVAESLAIGEPVVSTVAMDADIGANGAVSYSLTGTDAMLFDINTTSGLVTVAAALDRETAVQRVFSVVATDGGTPARTATAVVTVTLTDVNDEAPVFATNPDAITIAENLPEGTAIFQANARDADATTPNNAVLYTLTSGASSGFALTSDGILTVDGPLDFESRAGAPFEVTIRAEDQGSPQQVSDPALTLFITLTDENDNAPVIDRSDLTASVDEHATETTVFTASATDADISDDGLLRWTLVSVSPSTTAFVVDAATGTVSTAASPQLDREAIDEYALTLRVTDSANQTDEATWTVTVADINDNSPRYIGAPYVASVPETASLDTEVIQLVVEDLDDPMSPGGTISGFTLISDNSAGLFRLDTTNGKILTSSENLDAELGAVYRLTVQVSDGGGRTAQTVVRIQISDKNDESPVFTQATYVAAPLSEDAGLGTQVVLVEAVDADISPENSAVTYSILSDPTGYFAIDSQGRITVASVPMDREAFPNTITLLVRAADIADNDDTAEVEITLRDVNDNPPVFNPAMVVITLPEDSSVQPSTLYTVESTDRDIGDNAITTYDILTASPASSPFVINNATGELSISAPLDRESESSYTLVIRARNQEPGADAATLTLQINVGDVNDNAPHFVGSTSFAILESAATGTLLFTARAVDDDAGFNSNVTLTLGDVVALNVSTGADVDGSDIVNFEPATGRVTLARMVDREAISQFTAAVVATDGPGLETEQVFTVSITDVNDNSPRFTAGTYNFNIQENEDAGTPVGVVEAVDADAGAAGVVSYSFVAGTGSSLFTVDSVTGQIRTAVRLDADVGERVYMLTARATDSGSPAASTDQLVTINVLDVNDNAPVFSSASYMLNILENFEGDTGFAVTATDGDSAATRFGTISFSVEGGDADMFAIDEDTGALSVTMAFDRESQASFTLTVRATDSVGFNDSLTSTATISGSIIDVNDNMPVLKPRSKTVQVEENGVVPRVIDTIQASDADGIDATLNYTLQNAGSVPFSVDSSGVIFLTSPLDYEGTQTYMVQVVVADSTTETANAVYDLTVEVTDVNDNSPVFDAAVYQVTLLEDDSPPLSTLSPLSSPAGDVVLTVEATDADEDGSADITYAVLTNLTSGEVSTQFAYSGGAVVRTEELIDREVEDEIVVYLVATDVGGNANTATVIVTVEDRNDNDPTFGLDMYQLTVSEDTAVGTVLITVLATDADAPGFGTIVSYALDDDSGRFEIDASTGVVTVASALDFEVDELVDKTYMLTATDGGGNTGTASIRFTLTDVNDNSPVFDAATFQANIEEHSPAGTRVITVNATDADSGVNGEITYSVSTMLAGFTLSVDAEGVVRIATGSALLDRDAGTTTYSATVTATDGGGRATSTVLTIQLVDINDNTPLFASGNTMPAVLESAAVGEVVATYAFSDADAGLNADLVYYIDSDDASDPGKFEIDELTGELTVQGALDYEAQTAYSLVVAAEDREGEGGNVGTVSITVRIVDVNDNSPVFNGLTLIARLNENEGPQAVLRVQAEDADSGIFGTIVAYRLLTVGVPFVMEASTGLISSTGSVDREEQAEVLLLVQAIDGGGRASNATATILINDVNDRPPRFGCESVGTKVVSGSAQRGDVFTQVTATDADADASLTYRLRGGNCDGIFGVVASNGQVFVRQTLPRGTFGIYTMDVEVSDGRFFDYMTLIVIIDDGEVYRTNTKVNALLREVGSILSDDLPETVAYESLVDIPPSVASTSSPLFSSSSSSSSFSVPRFLSSSTELPDFPTGPGSSSATPPVPVTTDTGGTTATTSTEGTSTETTSSFAMVSTAPVLSSVATRGGNAEGASCTFPFVYKGITYESCTTVELGRFWCSIDPVFRPAQGGRWGNCDIERRMLRGMGGGGWDGGQRGVCLGGRGHHHHQHPQCAFRREVHLAPCPLGLSTSSRLHRHFLTFPLLFYISPPAAFIEVDRNNTQTFLVLESTDVELTRGRVRLETRPMMLTARRVLSVLSFFPCLDPC